MRAVELPRSPHGDPVVIEVPDPGEPVGSELLIRVDASSINGSDLNLRQSGVSRLITSRIAPGFDVAGTVVACGPRVTAFEPGDRVMALLTHSGGGQAQLVAVEQERAALVPGGMESTTAAAIPLAGLTALQAVRDSGRLQPDAGRRALVIGAAGGIGSFGVQIAVALGASVTAVASADRTDFLTALGADHVVDRNDPGWQRGGGRFDLILDAPSAFRFRDLRHLLTVTGTFVSTRPISTDTVYAAPPVSRRDGPRYSFVTTSPSSQDLAYLARLVQSGRMTVPLHGVHPVDDVAEAYRSAVGGVRGKVVITF